MSKNRLCIITKVTINGESAVQIREIIASKGFRSISKDFWTHFGMDNVNIIDWIEIRWPSYKITKQTNVSVDQI
ncbi:MAG: hypothetical protein GQ564_15105 [Bacteroidales bacterium]|nr:hypothetical protein [Bacteroidales bacterium]